MREETLKMKAARYVRLYGNGNTETDLNHCTEVEVYGKKPAAP